MTPHDKSKITYLAVLAMAAGTALLMVWSLDYQSYVGGAVTILLFGTALALQFWVNRCPRCKQGIDLRKTINFCPKCGEPIEAGPSQ
jgi:hypothetical protein